MSGHIRLGPRTLQAWKVLGAQVCKMPLHILYIPVASLLCLLAITLLQRHAALTTRSIC